MIKCPYCLDADLKEIDLCGQFRLLECVECKKHFKQYASYQTLQKLEDKQITKWFGRLELACKNCLVQKIVVVKYDEDFLNKLDTLREKVMKPFKINSFYRCPKHNHFVGGAHRSMHLQGKAVDLRVGKLTLAMMWAMFEKEGFAGMGAYPDPGNEFVHLDIAMRFSRWTRRNGEYVYMF